MQYAANVFLSSALPLATDRAETRSGEHVIFWLKATRHFAGTVAGNAPGLGHI